MAAPLCRRACTSAVLFTRNLRMPTYPISPRLHNYAKENNVQARINGPLGKTSLRSYSRIVQEVPDVSEDDVLYKKVLIEVKGHDTAVLNSYETFVSMAARELDVSITEIKTPPRVIERYTQLKSVHIYKKHRVQYETRTHFRSFTIKHVTGSTADTFLEYIQRNLPEGMAMKVTKNRIEALPDHLHPPQQQVTEGTL